MFIWGVGSARALGANGQLGERQWGISGAFGAAAAPFNGEERAEALARRGSLDAEVRRSGRAAQVATLLHILIPVLPPGAQQLWRLGGLSG
jgi:hypothetical protein